MANDILSEYLTVRESGAGLIDLSARGRIRVSGSEALMFLNGLITNDMKALAANRWMPAVFPNVQGRLLASIRLARLDDYFLIDTEAATHLKVLQTIERFTLAGDFRVSDITGETAAISLQGKDTADLIKRVLSVADVARDGAIEVPWQGSTLIVMRVTHTSEDGFDVVVESGHAASLWEAFISAGARAVGHDAAEVLRVEAGIPKYGKDMDETNVVTETNLDDAVSFTKGCYIGQEIIIRIKHRGHVAKKLRGLLFDTNDSVESRATITIDGEKEIGRITSTVQSPKLGKTIALGYVRFEQAAAGTNVVVLSGDHKRAATVTDLPFVRGSWYQD